MRSKNTKPVDCFNNNGPLNDFPQVSKTGYPIIVLVMAKSKQGEKIFTKENISNKQFKKHPSARNPNITPTAVNLQPSFVKFPCLCMTALAFRPHPVMMGSLSHNI